jgi:hypothetical protein
MPRAFIVYSSSRHVDYIDEVLTVIESVLGSFDIEIINFRQFFKGVRYIHEIVHKNISESDFAIVVLDGLRPNVTYELGLIQMTKIDVIPLVKKDAKFSVKSLYYNQQKKFNDSKLAFGEYRTHRAAFGNLKEPLIDISEHFSDCSGLDQIRYETIDDTEENGSLGKILREEVIKIIPHLRSRTGPGFDELHDLFPEINFDILNESIQLLSLFSVLGWNKNYEGDMTFQSIREEFVSFFINQEVSVDQVDRIFQLLLESPESIIKNYGRYLTVDSEKLIHQSFDFLKENPEIFNRYYRHILESGQIELKRRFVERITASDVLSSSRIEFIGSFIFDRSGFFPDISTIQDKESCRFFISSAYIIPLKALNLLHDWISPLTPMKIEELFPFQSTLFSPGNPQDKALWFLNEAAKNETYFHKSMEILFKFSIPIILHEDQILYEFHSSVNKLALDRFLEQCHSLTGKVSVITRWNFIKDLAWAEGWLDDYIQATKALKFKAIQTFLKRSWNVPSPVRRGTIRITHYTIPSGVNYETLEECRSEAYRLILEWLKQPEKYHEIYDSLFEFFYQNLPEFLKYISWDKLKSILISILDIDNRRILQLLKHIDNIRAYDSQQNRYSEEHLPKLFQFQEELEGRLTIQNYFRRNMNLLNTLQNELVERYIGMDDSEKKEITKILLFEGFSKSYEFGLSLKENLSWEDIKRKIEYCTGIIERDSNKSISDFYIGLWSALFDLNYEEWEKLLVEYWNKTIIRPYFEKILSIPRQSFSAFRMTKYKELFELKLIKPVRYLNVIYRIESISIDEKRQILIDCLKYFDDTIKSDVDSPVNYNIRFIWRIERLISDNRDLLNKEIADNFLKAFEPIRMEILSQISNTNFIIDIGQLSEQLFKNWLKTAFQLSLNSDSFLLKCADKFPSTIFQIAESLFNLPPVGDELLLDHRIANNFRDIGDPRILLTFSEEQINQLYELNRSLLGTLFGRLLRIRPLNEEFPHVLRKLIIQHTGDEVFKNKIFQEFSGGMRSFAGNNYDQQYEGDYKRIAQWRDSAVNDIFREWLQELHQHIDSIKEQNRNFWREREVE